MNQLAFFSQRNVRILGTPDKPLLVAKDICDIIGIANSRDAVAQLDDDEKCLIDAKALRSSVGNADTRISNQGMVCVNESGLYHLIFQSKKPEAKRFRKWVTNEVLPQIRKTGRYEPLRNDLPSDLGGLPAERRDYVILWLDICAEIAASSRRFLTAKAIEERHNHARGFNWRTIYRRFARWSESNCDWRTLDRWRGSYKHCKEALPNPVPLSITAPVIVTPQG